MGRGRKGITNQSTQKLVARRHQKIAIIIGNPGKRDKIKINLPEEALETMKNMNKQHLVDFLLSKGN